MQRQRNGWKAARAQADRIGQRGDRYVSDDRATVCAPLWRGEFRLDGRRRTEFTNGVIEFDVKGKNELQKSFVGVAGWFHARIVVAKPKVSVYVNGAKEPSLVVEELSDRKGGKIGFWVGDGSGGTFANLKITPTD